jgi:hypothetical protein
MERKNFFQNLPVLLSVVLTGLAIPLTLLAVKTNQDTRSEAMVKKPPLPTIKPIQPILTSPTPSPTLSPFP